MPETTVQLADLTVDGFLDRLASSDPAPGGGSASALAGAMAAGLVGMVAELTAGREQYAEHDAAVREIGAAAAGHRRTLMTLAQDDATAYDAVVRARRMPKETEAEQATRSSALRESMLEAARIPMQIATESLDVLQLAERIAPIGNKNAVSDAGVAALLAAAAMRGAILNVRINLPYLAEDEPMRAEAPAELARLEELAGMLETSAAAAVDARIGGA
jgi:formiminotetrahydrofolate cyclodeaminase